MKAFIPIVILSSLFAACAAMAAEPIVIEIPREAAPSAPPLTRAEVLADLHMWRVAGMQEFSRPEAMAQSERYRVALARYHALRASSQYTELVQKLQATPTAVVVGR